MPSKLFPLLGFQPDRSPDTAGVIVDSDQVLPTDHGFANGTDAELVGASFGASSPLGGIEVTKSDGTARQFIGTTTKIHELVSGAAVDRSAGVYHASLTQPWTFAQKGDITLATNKGDPLQQSTTGAFTATSAPKAAVVTVAGLPNEAFIFLGDYNDGTDTPDGVFFSPDPANWTPSVPNRIGAVRLTDINGRITAAAGFRDGVVVFKSGAMYLGQRTDPPFLWAFTRISGTVGCIGSNAVCSAGDVLYFADSFGLWQYDGSYPRPMPGSIHAWFAAQSYGKDVQLTWDARRHLVWVRYADDGFGNGLFLAFNVRSQNWTKYGAIGSAAHLIGANYAAAFAGGVSQFQAVGASNATNTLPARIRMFAIGALYGETTFRSMRPHFLSGRDDFDPSWVSGKLYHGPSLRGVLTNLAGDALAFAAPGRLDGVYQDRYMQPELTVLGSNAFELDSVAIDAIFTDEAE